MTLCRDFEEAAAKRMQKLQRAVIEASEPFVQMKIDVLAEIKKLLEKRQ